jgi:uncharacterized protein YkwD
MSISARLFLIAGTLAVVITATGSSAGAHLVAPRSKCAGQKNIKAPERLQEDAMRCLINYARQHSGEHGLGSNHALERAAGHKAGDVMHCGFSHTACGNPADLYPQRYGYISGRFEWGENLAWGNRITGSARDILKAWLNSPPHREAMLTGAYDDMGLGLKRGNFSGADNAAIWVLELGCHC